MDVGTNDEPFNILLLDLCDIEETCRLLGGENVLGTASVRSDCLLSLRRLHFTYTFRNLELGEALLDSLLRALKTYKVKYF